MTENVEEIEVSIQKQIRERGELVHADPELRQDELPVYFKLEIVTGYYLVVDFEKKDEIGVITPDNTYKVINQLLSELVFTIASEHAEIVEDYDHITEELAEERKKSRPSSYPGLPDWRDNQPIDITYYQQPQPPTIKPDDIDIPPGTPIADTPATTTGENDET